MGITSTTSTSTKQHTYKISRQQVMLGLVEALYNSGSINEETYIKTKRSIKKEVKPHEYRLGKGN